MKYFVIVNACVFVAMTILVIILPHGDQVIPFCVGLSSASMLLGAGIGRSLP